MNEFVKKTALSACTLFTLFTALWCLAGLVFAGPIHEIVVILSIMIAAIMITLLRVVWFTDKVFRNLAYPARIFGFGVTALLALCGCAAIGSWFPMDNIGAWVTFLAIFLVILAGFCIGYQIYFKRTSGSFDAALRDYHKRMGR